MIKRIWRPTVAASLLWATLAGAGGCSDGGAAGDGGGGQDGALATDGAALEAGGSLGPLDAGGTNLVDGGLDAGAASDGSPGIDAAVWSNVGVCAERGEATVDVSTFDGWEERYIISDSGFGSDADRPCVVRFALKRVGDAPHASACMDTLAKPCEWTHLVEYGNPQVLADTAGACAQSQLALTAAAIAKIVGSRVEVGFARQYAGAHGSSRMKYFEAMQAWDVAGNASWDTTARKLTYTFRDGFCGY